MPEPEPENKQEVEPVPTSPATEEEKPTTPIDKSPSLQTIENQTINEDTPEFTINLFATDIDNENGEIDYRAELNSGNMVSVAIQKDKLIITPLNNAYGKTEITIIALSNGKEDTTTFELIIEPKNDPPIITSVSYTHLTLPTKRIV